MSVKPLNLGIVGLGYWGPTLLRALLEVDGVEVGWVCDSDKSRLELSRRRYPAAKATTRIDDLLADPKLDAVVLATPVFTHFYLASRALTAGKHVFVEKPLATSSAEADQLARLAEMEGLVLMCGHTFIYSPPVRAVKELLDQDALGQIYFVSSSRVNLGLHQSDISVVWDLGPHDFSILLYWFEEMPTTIRAVGRDSVVRGITDVAFVTMDFPSGMLANVELSWLAPSKLRRTVVVGSEKMVVYDDGSAEPLRVFDHGVVYEDPETFGQYQPLLPHRRHRLAEDRHGRAGGRRARGLRGGCTCRRIAARPPGAGQERHASDRGCGDVAAKPTARWFRRRSRACWAGASEHPGARPGALALASSRDPTGALESRQTRCESECRATAACRCLRLRPARLRDPPPAGGGRLLSVVIALLATVVLSERVTSQRPPAPGARDGPGLVHDPDRLRPLQPRHQADQPLDRRRPALDHARDARGMPAHLALLQGAAGTQARVPRHPHARRDRVGLDPRPALADPPAGHSRAWR